MSGAQTSLALQDRLTGPLMKMIKAMDNTIKVMEKMDSATNNLDQKSLASIRKNITNASADMERFRSAMESASKGSETAARQQQKFNNSLGDGLAKLKSYTSGLLAAVGAYKMFNAAKSFLGNMFSEGIQFQALKQSAEAAFTIFLGDAKKAKQYMDDLYAFALTTPFAYPDLLESSRNLMAFGIEAKNTIPIMQAIGDAAAGFGEGPQFMSELASVFGVIQSQGRITGMELERLGAKGIDAAQMIGDMMGVSAEEMKKQISDGAIGANKAIAGLVEGMNKKFGGAMAGVKGTILGAFDSFKSSIRNAGNKMMEEFVAPLTRGIGNVTDLIKKIPEYIGPAVSVFLPVINMLNQALEEGKFDGFFQTMSTSLIVIATLFAAAAEGAIWFATIIDTFWPLIVTILLLIAATFIPMIISGLTTMSIWLYTVAQGWLVAIGPIGWVIIAVMALIGIMMAFGVTTEQILGFVMGLFFALGASVWNSVAYMWNIIVSFAEFLFNVFIDPIYAVKKLFYDLAINAINQLSAMAGGFDNAADVLANAFVSAANVAIGAINGVIKALNLIPGVNIGEIGKVSAGSTGRLSNGIKNLAKSLKAPTSDKGVFDFSKAKMSQMSIPGAFQSGYDKGSSMKMPGLGVAGLANFSQSDQANMNLSDLLDGSGAPSNLKDGKGKNPTGGKLDKVGKIEDEINISDEDLKLLRELADIRSIQNFVTLNPSTTLTGDMNIREEADIDKVIDKINENMVERMKESVEGVYT